MEKEKEMKYFEIVDSPELKYAPQLKNWYGKFDVRNIRIDRFPELPENQLFFIEPSDHTVYTDIIRFPFLLVSPMVKAVIRMYRECCFFRNIVLLDSMRKESRQYFLPVLDETNEIEVEQINYKNGIHVSEKAHRDQEILALDRHLFWARDYQKRHTILSMDMAESLIRRGITGLGLCEVRLYQK